RNWFGRKDLDGFAHRSWTKSEGFSEAVFDGRPTIGIANSWSELTTCNAHLRQVAEAVKRGVWSAGGFPLEFPTVSLGEVLMKPTAMLFRNLMSMDVEECIRAYPLDAVVLLSGCDKTTPAMLMGAASADVPALMVTGGPMLKGKWREQELGSGTDLWRLWAARGLRQRDPRGHGDRRQHERDHPPRGHRRARGGPAPALALRRAVADDPLHPQREPLRQVLDGGLLLRGRHPRRDEESPAAPPRGGGHGVGEDDRRAGPGRRLLQRGRDPPARPADRGRGRHGDPEGQPLPGWRGAQAVGGVGAPPDAPRAGGGLRGPCGPPCPHRRPEPARGRDERARPAAGRSQGGARNARVGRRAHPGQAPAEGRQGPGAHLRRAHERHLLWHRRPPRGAGGGRRRPARA